MKRQQFRQHFLFSLSEPTVPSLTLNERGTRQRVSWRGPPDALPQLAAHDAGLRSLPDGQHPDRDQVAVALVGRVGGREDLVQHLGGVLPAVAREQTNRRRLLGSGGEEHLGAGVDLQPGVEASESGIITYTSGSVILL